MTKPQLVKEIENSEYLLPKDILKDIDISTLEKELVEIFREQEEKIKQNKQFQKNYFELINYVVLINLRQSKKIRKESRLDNKFLASLLSIPELA